jgi:predicted lipoprotein with Yx(FWY)xxD motif
MQRIHRFLLFIIAAGHMLFYSSCKKDDTSPVTPGNQPEIKLAEHATLGKYLTDAEGRTLYIFTRDVAGSSVCVDGCLNAWPAFFLETLRTGSGLESADFGTITRPDGAKQTTYQGWPLYYYSGDAKAGDVNGEGVGEVWFVAKPDYSVLLADQKVEPFDAPLTKYIVDTEGRTLYYFQQDTENVSNCTGGCLTAWPAFVGSSNLVLPSTLDAAKFSIITRPDGLRQLAYRGRAMYYYAQDNARGEVKGQNVPNWTVSRLDWD